MHLKRLNKLFCFALSLALTLSLSTHAFAPEHQVNQYDQENNTNHILIERDDDEIERYNLGSGVAVGIVSEADREQMKQIVNDIIKRNNIDDENYTITITNLNSFVYNPRETSSEINQIKDGYYNFAIPLPAVQIEQDYNIPFRH